MRKRDYDVRKTGWRLHDVLWPHWRVLTVGLVLIGVSRLAGLALPESIRILVDDVVGESRSDLILPILSVVSLATLVQGAAGYVVAVVLGTVAHRTIAEHRIAVFQHIESLPLRYFENNHSGALAQRVMADIEGIRNLLGVGLVQFVGGVITGLAVLGMLLRLNVVLACMAIVFVLLFLLLMSGGVTRLRPLYRRRAQLFSEVSGRMAESFSGIQVVKAFQAEESESCEISARVRELSDAAQATIVANSRMTTSATVIVGGASAVLLAAGAQFVLAEEMTVGEFGAFFGYLALMLTPILGSVQILAQISDAAAGLDRVGAIMAETAESSDPLRTTSLDSIEGSVELRDVSFEYVRDRSVLTDITLDVKAGQSVAFVGPSGAGKSTLAALIAGFMQPSAGTIRVDGRDLSTVELESYRRQLGVVTQETFLFDGTVAENIRFARPSASDAEVAAAASVARINRILPLGKEGYATRVGQRGVKLSGGQRQCIAIARAVLSDPRILILDEATSNLDVETEEHVREVLAALIVGRTTFVIAHRLSTVRGVDEIVFLEAGRVAERGSHEALLKRRGRYWELCRSVDRGVDSSGALREMRGAPRIRDDHIMP